MASSAHAIEPARVLHLPLVRQGAQRLVRAPGRRGALTPEEAAHALTEQRAELRVALARRGDARGLRDSERDEVLDDAIATVVMSRKPIEHEQHLHGAFWSAVGFLLARRRTGSHDLRVGSRRRIDFDPVEQELENGGGEPFDVVDARDRINRAADLIAQLSDLERQVLAIRAVYGLGIKATAKALDLPVKTVLAASRSADRQLQQVAVIAAAGRMCDHRNHAIRAHAEGTALEQEAKVARAHIAACSSCRTEHVRLMREMRSREFRRAASAALLPPPVALAHAHGLIERMVMLLPGRAPGGTATAERAGLALGGGATVKAAATVGSVLVLAGAGIGQVIASHPAAHSLRHHRAAALPAHVVRRPFFEQPAAPATATSPTRPAPRSVAHAKAGHSARRPPSRNLGYLAIGQPVAPVVHSQARASSTVTAAPKPRAPQPSAGGGGTSLKYLGQ